MTVANQGICRAYCCLHTFITHTQCLDVEIVLSKFVCVHQAGMYTMGDGSLNKASFSTMEVPGFGNTKKVPTIESLFPFQKNGFSASGACQQCLSLSR
jgi:hypothetical protein